MHRRKGPIPLALATFLAFGGMLATPRGAAAQSAALSGAWAVTFDQAIRTEGTRVVEVQRRGTAELRLEQRGDSITGTWTRDDLGVARPLSGNVEGETFSLTSERWTVPVDGEPTPVWLVLRGALEDGEIGGDLYLHLGDRPAAARKWEAVRP